jgi:cytochrome c6
MQAEVRLMKRAGFGGICVFLMLCGAAVAFGQNPADVSAGEGLFKQYCQACHPNGKNVINPAKTLYTQDLKKNKIETPEAIVSIIRKAPAGMTSFSGTVVSDKDAEAIARYILQTFK